MEKQKSSGINPIEMFLERGYLARGIEQKKAKELTAKATKVLEANISPKEKVQRIEQLDKENNVPGMERSKLSGLVEIKLIHVYGSERDSRSFPRSVYK